MQIDILTLFPAMFEGPMTHSMMWKARDRGLLDLRVTDIREYAHDAHRKVDNTPYGGGGGMIMRPDVVGRAVEAVVGDDPAVPVILMSPQGRVFSHAVAVELAQHRRIVLLCGHYEGIDDRVRLVHCTDEISIGDYVLTGGELAAMVIVDAVARHLPGVLGSEGAADRDSHANGLLEGPQYTRPLTYRDHTVPVILQEGNHAAIAAWRRIEGLRRTWEDRPDLLMHAALTEADKLALGRIAEVWGRSRR